MYPLTCARGVIIMSILIEKDIPKCCSQCAAFYKKSDKFICKLIPATKNNEYFNANEEIMDECPLIESSQSKWLETEEDGIFYYVCEKCRNINNYKTNYCPYCGAEMIKDESYDTISRSIAIESIKQLLVIEDENCEEDPEHIKKYNNGIYNAINVLNVLPPIETTKEETAWISCADELPPQNEIVLIYMKGRIEFGQYYDDQWHWLFESCMDYWEETDDVEKWMSLPTKGIEENG